MVAFEEVLLEEEPDLVIVVGDVNSTLACSLVASKLHIPVAHVEAGLRSNDRQMPEEINRLVTDSISDYLFVTEQSGLDNLAQEGVAEDKVFFVGNLMIDSLVQFREKARQSSIMDTLDVASKDFVLMTMHRPSNVDHRNGLHALVDTLTRLTALSPVVFPMHPRTKNRLAEFGMADRLQALPNLTILEPLGYLEFLCLMDHAAVVVTDSGGIQEETTYLQVPCLTLRDNTERPITVTLGTNELMPLDPSRIEVRVRQLLMDGTSGQVPSLWDGHAADRIVATLDHLFPMRAKAA